MHCHPATSMCKAESDQLALIALAGMDANSGENLLAYHLKKRTEELNRSVVRQEQGLQLFHT